MIIKNLLEQIQSLIDISRSQKEIMNKICLSHISTWSPALIHDCIHHCLSQDVLPEKFDDESEFEFESRCVQIRRRLINENRLAACLISLLEEKDANQPK